MRVVLAIDAGTTGVRALLVDETRRVVASAYVELRTSYPRPGWAEQNGADVWAATRSVVGEALARAGLTAKHVEAIGIANQRSSLMAWSSVNSEPISPLILWHDTRAVERCRELSDAGFYVTPTMAVGKADWLWRNEPAVRVHADSGTLRLGGMESWLCAKLTGGCHVADHANASATGFYAHFERTWDAKLLDAIGIEPGWLPELVDSCGVVAESQVDAFGAKVPVAAMCGDQQASLFGLGCTQAGLTKCSYGTAAMLDVNSGAAIAIGATGTYPLVAWSIRGEPTYCVEANVVTAGAAVQWLRDGLGIVASASDTAALAESVGDSGGVWAVPAFQGLGTPVMNAQARAIIGGLSSGSRREHLVRAVLEGIAHRVADAAEALAPAVTPTDAIRVDGGASRNDFLMQTQADLLGATVERSAVSDGAAVGAAALAALAVGFGVPAADASQWSHDRAFEPNISADQRAMRRQRWRGLLDLAARA